MSEILAPCGGIDGLAAALNAGADAVYVGLKSFSARKNAENFSDEQLALACRECHRRGVKLYAALNTVIFDREAEDFAECVKTAARCGADGLIIQDLGAAEIAREVCPEMPLHASTQMTLNSVCGVKAAERCGFSRAVLGRELSFSQIRHIAENTSAELEVFVHGALCVSVSGQCYMSSVFGGRSGNRGLCAQPCRLDFSCGGRHSVISLKDQSLITHLKELEEAGVTSFKIEGRMKRPEYAACAADACRRSLAGLPYDRGRLEGIFSRGGLTEGYYTGEMTDMQGTRGKEDVESSAKALNGIKAIYRAELPRLGVDITAEVRSEKPATAKASCGDITVTAEGAVPQAAVSSPLNEKAVCERMAKLGGTQFYAGEVSAAVDEGLNLPASALNELRRSLCEKLDSMVLERNTPKYGINVLPKRERALRPAKTPEWRAEVHTARQLEQALKLPFGLIYAPLSLLSESTPHKERIAVTPPAFLADCEERVRGELRRLRELGFCRGTAHTLGHAFLLGEEGFAVHGSFRMNITNSYAADFCGRFGFSDMTLSFEGTAAELAEISCGIPCGIVAYGRLPLMLLRRCPAADGKPCGKGECGEFLTDRKGNKLPLLCGGNTTELLNPDTLVMSDKPRSLSPFDFAVLRFTTETEIKPVLDMYISGGKPQGSLTRGLYFRGAE